MVFVIFAESEVRDGKIARLISALSPIESIGHAKDMLEAIEAIQSRYPGAKISDGRIIKQKPELLARFFTGDEGNLIVLPENHRLKDRTIYIGVDFSLMDYASFENVIRSTREVIAECHSKAAN